MPRQTNLVPVPRLRLHAGKRRLVVDYRDPASGGRRQCVLGPPGSAVAADRYRRLLADLAARRPPESRAALPPIRAATVAELCVLFNFHAARHYVRADGSATNEPVNFRRAVLHLAAAAGHLPPAEFGPVALRRVRDAMVAAGWCRTTVNAQVNRVRRVFKWAAAEELVPASVWLALKSLPAISAGRGVREAPRVRPADQAGVAAARAVATPTLAGMIGFQLLTGCRPQDVCGLTAGRLDRTGAVWAYRPEQHKGAWRGAERVVYVGPRAQALLGPHLAAEPDPAATVFSPRRSYAERLAARAAARAAAPPKHHTAEGYARLLARKRSATPYARLTDRFTPDTYGRAVRRACRAAGVEPFAPNRLRHLAGTLFRAAAGAEVARELLGHAHLSTTEIYAEPNRKAAEEAMLRLG